MGKLNEVKQLAAINWLAFFMFGFLAAAVAGEVSVFQHALEYEPPEPYEAVIHYSGKLTEGEQELVDKLEQTGQGEGPRANISVVRNDISAQEYTIPEYQDKSLPRLELRYPAASGISGTLWQGPLEEETVENMLDSPARQRIADKLIDRRAAVWILIQSTDESENARVQKFLEETLAELQETLEVPHPEDAGEIYSDIDFGIIALDREAPEEQMLINMLLGSERDLVEYKDKPIVFPAYGRGAVMYALAGDGINKRTLHTAGEFLAGPCSSCQLGASGSNLHLLMFVDWDGRVEQLSNYDNAERRYGTNH